jgi:DNA polymerase I-like protein with 3'-5' exonuclease and polymerase domains
MVYTPSLVSFDVETTGLEYWHPDFRVLSSAFSWRNSQGQLTNHYCQGEHETAEYLKEVERRGLKLAAHNLQFEYGVLRCRFPSFNRKLLEVDTQRLAQNYDSGGKRYKTEKPTTLEDELKYLNNKVEEQTGLGLEACVSRVLPKDWHNHKEPYYQWLRDNGVKRGQEGRHLHLLPPEMLEAYNTADTDVTLVLAEFYIDAFQRMNFNWKFDHYLHVCAIERLVEGKVRGIRVDQTKLQSFIDVVKSERAAIKAAFFAYHEREIELIETARREAWVNAPKTEKGRVKREAQVWDKREEWEFNPRSTKQLQELFVHRLGAVPKFWTKPAKDRDKEVEYIPSPSFRAAHLPTYGEGGVILANYKKRELVQRQAENLLALSTVDGRWHYDLRACGTKTGRYTGGSSGEIKLNIQALARKEKGLMSCLVAEPGYKFVSIDLSSGEPTVVAHYSQDENYIANAFGMAGKKPYWKGELLMLDDPYLSFASISPLGKATIRKAWDEGLFETWNDNEAATDAIKGKLKKLRAFHKTLFLALLYGQSPKGMVSFASDNGEVISFAEAKEVHKTFWRKLYPKVGKLADAMVALVERQGFLVNAFGFRMTPEQPRLALNYRIQSSVSGIIKIAENKLYKLADYAIPGPVIHDEILPQIPDDKVDLFRADVTKAFESLNSDLKWTVEIRNGFVPGNNLSEAK